MYAADQITFAAVTDGAPILLTLGTLLIASNLQTVGNGSGVTIVDGSDLFRVFLVNVGVTAELRALTIRNGSASGAGAGIGNQGTLTVADTTLSDNTVTAASGGGIFNAVNATLTVTGSTFTGNGSTGGSGGAIANDAGGTVEVTNSTLSGNSVTDGGGIYTVAGTTLKVTGTILNGNTAISFGGGIVNNTGGSGGTAGAALALADGTATAGSDYTNIGPVAVTFAQGRPARRSGCRSSTTARSTRIGRSR